MDLVLPCRYAPGPLASDPANFYHHTWRAILNGNFIPISSIDNIQDNFDFSLTLFNVDPFLAQYDYLCDIIFSGNAPSQPYNLSSSSGGVENAIDVIILEIEGHYMHKMISVSPNTFLFTQCTHCPYIYIR